MIKPGFWKSGSPKITVPAAGAGAVAVGFWVCSPTHVAAYQERAAMVHIVDFLQSQPPDVFRFVLNAIKPLWLEPKAHATVSQAIKQQFPGKFSDDEVCLLIQGAMFIMK